jgi:hypothetical protein
MGRNTSGSVTTGEAMRIELSYLLKNKFIVKGKDIYKGLGWSNGSSIAVFSVYDNAWPFIRLLYSTTDNNTGEKTEHNEIIYLAEVPSNLDKGYVLYFLCPVTGRKCRILYKCYGSPIWKSRSAYQNRIYYQSQVSSKLNYFNDRYWRVEKQLKQLYSSVVKSQYKGRKTRLQQRIERLEYRQSYYDEMRWSRLPRSIQKLITKNGIYSAKDLI